MIRTVGTEDRDWIRFVPAFYTPNPVTGLVERDEHVAAHLAGIGDKLDYLEGLISLPVPLETIDGLHTLETIDGLTTMETI